MFGLYTIIGMLEKIQLFIRKSPRKAGTRTGIPTCAFVQEKAISLAREAQRIDARAASEILDRRRKRSRSANLGNPLTANFCEKFATHFEIERKKVLLT